MAKVTVGKWGKNVALRMPAEILKATGLKIGEEVEIKVQDRKIVVSRPDELTRAEVDAAVKRIIRRSRGHTLGGISIRELIGRDKH